MIIEIDKRFFKSNQSWCYTRIITLKIQKAKFSEHGKAVNAIGQIEDLRPTPQAASPKIQQLHGCLRHASKHYTAAYHRDIRTPHPSLPPDYVILHKLKAEIRRNAYDDQSYARCYKFDGNKWNLVCSIPIKDCECQVVSYVCKKIDARKDLFFQDSQTLFEIAKKIIS
jgi:hypothetical protein